MKRIDFLIALTLSLLLGCSGRSAEQQDHSDSVIAYSDTSRFVDESDSTYITGVEAPDIRTSVDNLIAEQNEKSDSYFTLRLSASGYEYRTEEVWSFDSLMNLVHCHQDWSSEGSEGTSDHLFRQEKLYAVRDETGNDSRTDVEIYHAELGGVSLSEPGDSVAKTLDKKYLATSENDLKSRFAQIVRLLKDNASDIDTGDPATLHIENESSDEELPGKDVTDITVDRKLLEELLR
jgi:hypothetical protein